MYAGTQVQTQATFHVMPEGSNEQSLLYFACVQAAHFYRQNQRVFIFTRSQEQAHQVDEMLWSFDADSFVPHNLVGEGPRQGAMVEIGWQPPRGRRPILINLTDTVPQFAGQFSQIVDFVPNEEAQKVHARSRWSALKQGGIMPASNKVETSQLSTLLTTS